MENISVRDLFQRTRSETRGVTPTYDTNRLWEVAEQIFSHQLVVRYPDPRIQLLDDTVLDNLVQFSIGAACRFINVWSQVESEITSYQVGRSQAA